MPGTYRVITKGGIFSYSHMNTLFSNIQFNWKKDAAEYIWLELSHFPPVEFWQGHAELNRPDGKYTKTAK